MSLNAVKILKISITNNSKKEILEEIQKYLSQKAKTGQKTLKILTPNTEQLVFASKNPYFTHVLNQADIAVPDTVGIVWAGHILTKNGPDKPIPGVEFMEDIVQLAQNRHVAIGLIGGRDNLAVETLHCLQKKYPGLEGWATKAPEFLVDQNGLHLNYGTGIMNYGDEKQRHDIHNSKFIIHNSKEDTYFEALAKRIVESGVRIVFVALGPPKQEMFIEKLSDQLSVISKTDNGKPITDNSSIVLMAVGGSFDILSGRLPRAPLLFRSIGFEWLWRLVLEPWRIGRQLALVEFVWLVLRERLSRRP